MRGLLILLPAIPLVVWLRGCEPTNTVPEQIHLALAGQDSSGAPTGMRVAWYTQDLPSSASTVKYGLKSGVLSSHVSATNAPAQYLKHHGFHHVVAVLDLTPATRYYYSVGNDADGWSAEWSFKTAPSGDAAAKTQITVSVFGDHGWLDSEQRPMEIARDGLVKNWSATLTRTRLEALKDELDMVFIVGDISYADDSYSHSLLGFSYEKAYNGYLNWMQNLTATMPVMVMPGNHESECHSPSCVVSGKLNLDPGHSLKNFSAYNARWHMPSDESVGPGTTHSMWYSFNYGPVHFVSANTETDFPNAAEKDKGDSGIFPAGHFGEDGEYLRWLEADLKAAAQARAQARNGGTGPTWIVVGGHRPFGDIEHEHIPLFHKYGVDLYVAGHSHSYARGAPVNGTAYVVVGGAGCEEMQYVTESDSCIAQGSKQACTANYEVPEGTETFRTSRYATGILKADAKTLNWQLIDSATGKVLDEVSLNTPAVSTTIV